MLKPYNKSIRATLADLDTSEHGLSQTAASERLRQNGLNTVEIKGRRSWKKLIDPFTAIFTTLLLMAAIISFYHGDKLDGWIILAIMLTSIVVYSVQRFSTERILRTLQKHTKQLVLTYREGKEVRIDSTELVAGDVITLTEGEKVPADARLLKADNLRVDESVLVGNSAPVSKQIDALKGTKQAQEQSNMLFQGSFITAGTASAVITSTGQATEFGKVAALVQDQHIKSPIQRKINRFVMQCMGVMVAIAIVALTLAIIRGMDIAEALKFVLALSVSAVPESLPIATSVVLILLMRRMAARKVLVRTMQSIESIGAVTTIATGKTAILTQNKFTVQEVWQAPNTHYSLEEISKRAINTGSAASHNPLDAALIDHMLHGKPTHAQPACRLPFDQSYFMSGNVWQQDGTYSLDIKGAPEYILHHSDLTTGEHEKALVALHRLTSQGYRVLAIATTELTQPIASFSDIPKKVKFHFVGFIAIADSLRPEAKRAIATATAAGVTVRIITGDHTEAAYHIAYQLGIVSSRQQVFDARHMSVVSDEELSGIIKRTRVFSRVAPEHKNRLLTLLSANNITAVTGDGVSDVPALANAQVAVATGSSAHITKDAADILLLDNNFTSLIEALRQGRIVLANIRRMLYFLLTTGAGETLVMLAALAAGMPIPLLPIQILWINLVTNTSLVIPLGLEKGERDVMKKPPQGPGTPILNGYMISRIILVALAMAATTLAVYFTFVSTMGESYARTIAFCALVAMQWANALNARSNLESIFSRMWTWSTPFVIGLVTAIGLQTLAVFGPLHEWLHIETVALGDLFLSCFIAFIVPLVVVELHKFIGRAFVYPAHKHSGAARFTDASPQDYL